jgi:LruC domain-containing protein
MKVRTGLFLASGVTLLSMTGCIDSNKDYFDAEATKAIYEESFPVSDIDPDTDWKTTRSVSLSIAVEEDADVDYKVRAFTADPLTDSSAKLIVEGVARKGQPFTSTIECPNALSGVVVTRSDDHGRVVEKIANVANGSASVVFGSSETGTRAGIRTAAAKTRASESVEIPTLSPNKTAAQVEALLASAAEYTGGYINSGSTLKISAGKTVEAGSAWDNDQGTILIVKGTLTISSNSSPFGGNGFNLYVLNGGKVTFTDGYSLNGSTLTVFEGGTIEGSGSLNLGSNGAYPSTYWSDANFADNFASHSVFYNAGTINVTSIVGGGCDIYNDATGSITTTESVDLNNSKDSFINRGTANVGATSQNITMIYNAGTLKTAKLESNLTNAASGVVEATAGSNNYNKTIVNDGKLTVEGVLHGSIVNNGDAVIGELNVSNNNSLTNNCYFLCKGDLRGDVTMAPNTRLDIEGNVLGGYTYTLAENSMINVTGQANLHSATFKGPSGSAYGLFRAGEITDFQTNSSDSWTPCHIYIECDNISDTSTSNVNWTLSWLGYVGGAFAKVGDSPFILPTGDCSGEGSEPNEDSTTEDEIKDKAPLPITYAFEDNYPSAGDYDFNDIVIDVAPSYERDANNNVEAVNLAVTLRAAGGVRIVGAGIRLVDVNKSDVTAVSFSGDDVNAFRNTLSGSQFGTGNTEPSDNNVVIPLFGDAHTVFGVASDVFVNTDPKVDAVATKTMNVRLTTNKEINKSNLDVFITNNTTISGKRVEIHLYEMRDYGATAAGTVITENLDAAANRTWALAVPDFKYPVEYVSIKRAYPNFGDWAQNHDGTNEDWYENPTTTSGRIYE